MKPSLSLLLSAFALAPLAPVQAQCGGQGNLVFEVISLGNQGTVPGSFVTFRLTGAPNEYICFACDTGDGPVTLGDLGTFCLDFSPSLIEFAFALPPSGVFESTAYLPPEAEGLLLCCQAIGIEATQPLFLGISNGICFTIEESCTGGGLESIAHQTRFENITSFPVQVTTGVIASGGGTGTPESTVSYDPLNPPSFPLMTNDAVVIENIARIGDDLVVTTLVRATAGFHKNGTADRLPNELDFSVTVGTENHFVPGVHVSCSQPIGVGMVFGDFTITGVGLRY